MPNAPPFTEHPRYHMVQGGKWLLFIVACASVLRLGAITYLKSWRSPNAIEHAQLAKNIIAGDGFTFISFGVRESSSVQSPTYPLFLAGLFWIFGVGSANAYAAALLINAVLGAMTAWLTFHLVKTLGGSDGVGLLAAAACAVWPTQIYAATHAQAITMTTAAVVAMMILFYRAVRSGGLGAWIGFSVIGCVAALTEPALLPPMVISGCLVLLWRSLDWRIRLRNAAILMGVAVLVFAPWTLRNYRVHGRFVPVKSTFWVNLWKANKDGSTGTDRVALTQQKKEQLRAAGVIGSAKLARDASFDATRQYDTLTPEERSELEGKREIEREDVFKRWTTRWIAEHRGEYVRLCGVRLAKTLWLDWDNPKSMNIVVIGSRSVLLFLSAVGLVVAMQRGWSLLWPAVMAVCCLALYTLTITAARFALPFEPFQFCLMSSAICQFLGRFRPARESCPAEGRRGELVSAE